MDWLPESDWVVVLLTASECDVFPDTKCVQSVIGPLASKTEADAEAATWPEWCAPHTMRVKASERRWEERETA